MKAATWQQWISIAFAALVLTLALQPASAGAGALPAGLPKLPSLGETMGRDVHSGLALSGIDPVAYHTERRPVAGDPQHELTWRGVVWRFSSAANLAAFREAPEVYEPAFSGFDPTGVAEGRAVDSDPRHFLVLGSRLFVFHSAETARRFGSEPALVAQATERWPAVAAQISSR